MAGAGRVIELGMKQAWVILCCALSGLVHAAEVSVAAAANLSAPLQAITQAFTQATGHTARVSLGSTGRLYAQIRQGAPFDVLLAADDTTPLKLEQEGWAVPGTRATYAVGRLVLWSPQPGRVDAQGAVLNSGELVKLAVAEAKLAPYGAAAQEVLQRQGVWARWQPHLVFGESIGQAHQFVASGNAPMGLVALSQVQRPGRAIEGSAWVVPQEWHKPLRQDLVLLKRAQGSAAAQAWVRFMQGPQARAILRDYGYGFAH